nr:PREDICTED: cysteine-rich venom protein LEI1 isoform X2 [Tribolium castaneum]|eukprot:XP_015837342.1 PREDICTED: cysteine-rich venom protein LEI1 isoform X2 [Tribolium castaneum]
MEKKNLIQRKLIQDRQEIGIDEYVEFRQVMLDIHNELRNKVASGKETRATLPTASNMMAMSYSLELEYISRCYMRNAYTGIPAKCRTTSDGRSTGQVTGGVPGNNSGGHYFWIPQTFNDMLHEGIHMTEKLVDSYTLPPVGKQVSSYVEVIWSTFTQVGCARVYTPDPKKIKYLREFYYGFICTYASTLPQDMVKEVKCRHCQVYKKGTPCSECPENFKCNEKYTSLCGEIPPVPTDLPYDIDNKYPKPKKSSMAKKTFQMKILIFVTICSSFLLYLNH